MSEVPRPEAEVAPAPAASTASFKSASAAEVPWWKNMAVLIGVLAFILSLLTAIISAYTAYKKDVHDQQAELSAVVEKLLQIPVTEASLSSSIRVPNVNGLELVFLAQRRMLTLEAYNLARRLGQNAAAPELMTVGEQLVGFENYHAAKEIYRQATSIADNFSDEVSALRAFAMTMIRFAQNDRERAEGEQALEEAMNIGAKYPDVGRNPEEISYAHALTQLAWTDAWSGFDCTKAGFHLQQADKFAQGASATPLGGQVQMMAKAWREALTHCNENNRLPFQWYPAMAVTAGSTGQPLPPAQSNQPAPLTLSRQPPPAPPGPTPVRR